ncbi:TPA: redoxin domain-containing protein, partial [Candidatus Poribacteria bacterium]|nr:redoxin domain-containing protein [Candidatus Poribacteria bacterium]
MRKDLCLICYMIFSFMCCFPTAKAHKINQKNNVIEEQADIELSLDPIPDLTIETIRSELYSIDSLCRKGLIVLVFTSTKCPVTNQYTQRLNRMNKNYTNASVIGVYSNHEDTVQVIAKHVKEIGILFHTVKDFDGKLANQLGATMTPQAFVIDQNRIIRYRGPVDDNRYANRVREKYLQNAIDQLLSDQEITVSQADSFGCTIHLPEETAHTITYARHIAPIIQRNCQSCHRSGQVAPFPLMTYEDAKTWSTEMVSYTQSHLMPLWKPEPGYGDFKQTRRMWDWEVDKITEWVKSGMSYGNEADLPVLRSFDNSWFLGEPDLLVEMPEPYDVPADGEDEYRHFIIPTNFDQDMYVQAIDIEPGNQKTVHHVIVYLDTTGKARELDAADPKPGYARFGGTGFDAQWLGGWAPGV